MSAGGTLRHRLSFQQRTRVNDGKGNLEGPFEEIFQAKAAFIPLKGGETVMAARLESRQPVIIRVHLTTATRKVTSDWRAVRMLNGQVTDEVYNIRSIADFQQRGHWLDMAAESGVASG